MGNSLKFIQEFLHKPMSRRDFLKYLGIMLLSLVGISNVLKNLKFEESSSSGYGNTTYGGHKGGI